MGEQDYGGATIVPVKTRGELRVNIGGDVRYLTPREARELASAIGDVPDNIVALDDTEAFIDGLAEEVNRL